MKISDTLINFLVWATIVSPEATEITGPCYLLMARNIPDL